MGISDLYVALIYGSFLVIGFTAPFVFTLGYLWVDTFYPQFISSLISQIPSALIMGIAAIGGYILLDRRSPPRFSAHTFLVLVFAAWITLTGTWAEWPDSVWDKWNWSFKTVVFAAFLTLVLRSRIQIEAFIQVFLFAACVHMVALGTKTMLSGSGYGRELGVYRGNAGLGESSYLAAVSIALIPIILFLRNHSILIPKSRIRDLGYLGMIVIAVFSAMGTYARTALVGFAVVGVFLWLQSRRKILFTVCAVAIAIGVVAVTASSWEDRIETTADFDSESSALARILVWKWTLAYVAEHPLGGGFDSFRSSRIVFPSADGPPRVEFGRAFHNMFIEVLGEHGYPGLAMYLTLMFTSLGYMWSVIRRTRGQIHLLWVHDLAGALMTALLTIMACGCFIGIAFQSLVWYLITLPVCLSAYLARVEALERGAGPLPWMARPVGPAMPGAARMAR